jgi:hypothetical protein
MKEGSMLNLGQGACDLLSKRKKKNEGEILCKDKIATHIVFRFFFRRQIPTKVYDNACHVCNSKRVAFV